MQAASFQALKKTMLRFGPYVLIELLLPGGTLLALLLWLSNGMSRGQLADTHLVVMHPTAATRVVDDRNRRISARRYVETLQRASLV